MPSTTIANTCQSTRVLRNLGTHVRSLSAVRASHRSQVWGQPRKALTSSCPGATDPSVQLYIHGGYWMSRLKPIRPLRDPSWRLAQRLV